MNGRTERTLRYEKKIQDIIQKCGNSSILSNYNKYLGSSLEANTIYDYMVYISEFLKYVAKEKDVSNITLDTLSSVKPFEINDFIKSRYMKKDDNTEYSTEHAAICWSGINSFYKFLCINYDTEMTSGNPCAKTERPKIRSRIREEYLTPAEIKKFMNRVRIGKRYADGRLDSIKYYCGIRDYLMCRLFIQLGLRVSAVIGINVGDIDLEKMQLTVREKGNKPFIYDITTEIKDAYEDWMLVRPQLLGDQEVDALFVSHRKKRISYITVHNMVAWYGEYIGRKNITPHSLRHTFGTNLYNITKDIRLVQEEMRHKKITTTERYITINKDKINEARAKMAALC